MCLGLAQTGSNQPNAGVALATRTFPPTSRATFSPYPKGKGVESKSGMQRRYWREPRQQHLVWTPRRLEHSEPALEPASAHCLWVAPDMLPAYTGNLLLTDSYTPTLYLQVSTS